MTPVQNINYLLLIETTALFLSVALQSIVLSLAISLVLFGTFSYLVMGAVLLVYSAVAIQSGKSSVLNSCPTTNEPAYPAAIILIALCFGAMLFGHQFEYASIQGDHGVYINAAIHLQNEGQIPFSLSELGIDLASNGTLMPPQGVVNPAGENLWQFHGLPVWPAFMAASQFSNGGQPVLAILMALNIILFFVVAKTFSGNVKAATLATLVFAGLPVLWHQTLYATSEMLLLSIFLSSLVLASKLNRKATHLGIGLFAYGTTHTGILILAPAVGAIFFLLGALSNKITQTKLAVAGFMCALGSLLAYKFALSVSTKYAQDITSDLFGDSVYLAYVACSAPLLMAIPAALRRFLPGISSSLTKIVRWIDGHFALVASLILICLSIILLVQAYLLGWTEYYTAGKGSWAARPAYVNLGFSSLSHLSVVSIFMATAGLGSLAFIALPFRKRIGLANKLLWFFALILILVFGIYRVDVTNNFYGSRYFLPVLVPCLLILFATLLKTTATLRVVVIPVITIAFIFNGMTLGQGFFLGDGYLKSHIQSNLDEGDVITFHGSEWLQYMVYPILLKRSAKPPTTFQQPKSKSGAPGEPKLITDSTEVLGGEKDCIEYIERRIPWKIMYPSSPQLLKRHVCVIDPGNPTRSTFDLPANDWVVNGQFEFLVVKPVKSDLVIIEFSSHGWWSEVFQKNNIDLKPTLRMCDVAFENTLISPKKLVFTGKVTEAFCRAKFTSNVFIPENLGIGTDKRSLGADISSITMTPL